MLRDLVNAETGGIGEGGFRLCEAKVVEHAAAFQKGIPDLIAAGAVQVAAVFTALLIAAVAVFSSPQEQVPVAVQLLPSSLHV